MGRVFVEETIGLEGKEIELAGWVHARRDHGKLIFIDLRDRTGIVQVVFGPDVKSAGDLRLEYVMKITGLVKARPTNMVNDKILTGRIEIEAKGLEIVSHANEMLIPVDTDGYEINEETRLKYRYLDLRRERLMKNLIARHKVIKHIRDILSLQGFVEVETPILSKSTPEGARDYLVPSRLQKGNFYALPQSPQQYKQLLMVAGVDKYFQIARCFRDEDTRGDRQPEFTQLDMEMSFVEREDVMRVNEELLIDIVQTLYPEKEIQEVPFPHLTYKEAVEKYGTDRPDLRKDKENPNLLAFCWVVDFPFFSAEGGEKTKWTFTHNPFSAPKLEFAEDLMEKRNIENILTSQYDVVLNGWEIGGGSIRQHSQVGLFHTFEILGYPKNEIIRNFGHIIDAFTFGAPPHGGIAWGLDRLVMVLQNEPNIREVIAFPKTGDGRDPMMGAPSGVDDEQLKELGIKVIKDK